MQRSSLLGVVLVGADVPRLSVPPRREAYAAVATTQKLSAEHISGSRATYVIAHLQHMHQIGRKQWVELGRPASGVAPPAAELACNTAGT